METDNRDLLGFWKHEKEEKRRMGEVVAAGRKEWEERERKIIFWAKDMEGRALRAEQKAGSQSEIESSNESQEETIKKLRE